MIRQNIFTEKLSWDGKVYTIHLIRKTRAAADKVADSLRRKGYAARVTARFERATSAGGDIPPFGVYVRNIARRK